MNGNWLLGCQSPEGRKGLWMRLCKEVIKGRNFTIMGHMLLDCWNSLDDDFFFFFKGGDVAYSCRKWAIWKENCSDLPGQEL